MGRGILLLLLGVPIPIIILLALFFHWAGSGHNHDNAIGRCEQNTRPGWMPFGGRSVLGSIVDYLFRTKRPDPPPSIVDARQQSNHILTAGMVAKAIPPADSAYLAQLVAQQAGVSPAEALNRVQTVIAREQEIPAKIAQTADTARKAASAVSIFTALSMPIGALIASAAAARGGQRREQRS